MKRLLASIALGLVCGLLNVVSVQGVDREYQHEDARQQEESLEKESQFVEPENPAERLAVGQAGIALPETQQEHEAKRPGGDPAQRAARSH